MIVISPFSVSSTAQSIFEKVMDNVTDSLEDG